MTNSPKCLRETTRDTASHEDLAEEGGRHSPEVKCFPWWFPVTEHSPPSRHAGVGVLWNVSPAPAAGPAELCQGKGQLCAGPSPSELSGGRAEPAHGEDPAALSWSSAHLYSALPASLWQLVTATLCARCQGTGKPGRMKPFGVLTQTLIKCPGWAFIPPLDPCLQLLNCSCFFQMCYFIMMPPGLDRRAIIIFIV